jgi:hypothetical protein
MNEFVCRESIKHLEAQLKQSAKGGRLTTIRDLLANEQQNLRKILEGTA